MKVGISILMTLLLITFTANGLYVSDKDELQFTVSESANAVSGEIDSERIESEKEKLEENIDENINFNSTMPYYIRVNRLQNVVNVYARNEDGTYSPLKAMICSIGKATPESGTSYQTTTLKCRWSSLKGNVYGQYITQIVDSILFHSVPYTKQAASALEYWEYDKLGTAASLGCIRLTVKDAKWIYENIVAGTTVEFYEEENPGPFGKPIARKISDNETCRDWDPTDLTEGNPWNSIK